MVNMGILCNKTYINCKHHLAYIVMCHFNAAHIFWGNFVQNTNTILLRKIG